MTPVDELEVARDLALRKIGRNVVLFQKMEGMLRHILATANYSQPVSRIAAHLSERQREHRTRPMGELVERTAKTLVTQPAPPPEELTEPWITFSYTFDGVAWTVKDWRREMRKVVAERNQLIHRTAATIDLGSVDGCKLCCGELDLQQERVMPAYNRLTEMVSALSQHGRLLSENIDQIVEHLTGLASSHDA